MNQLIEHSLRCPYCDASTTILIDGSVSEQDYVEDCQVCCRPILLGVSIGADGEAVVVPRAENE